MRAVGLLGILWWAGPPLIGALLGCLAALAIVRILTRPSFLGRLLSSLLALPLSSILKNSPARLEPAVQSIARGALRRLVSSPPFLTAVREAISGWVSSFAARTVKDVMDDFGVSGFLSDKLLPSLAGEEQRAAIARAVESAFTERSGAAAPDGAASDAFTPGIEALCASFLPAAVDRIVEGLTTEQTRSVLAARGRELLPKILERLNLFQRFLLTAGQFDRRLDEKMPEIVDETIVAIEQVVRDPQQQKLFLEKLLQGLRDWHGSPQSRGQAGPAVAGLLGQAMGRLADTSVRQRAARLILGFVGDEHQTIGSALRLRFGVRDSELSDSLSNAALTWLCRPETEEALSQRIARTACAFLHDDKKTPLGELLALDAERREELTLRLSERAASARRLGQWAGLAGAGLGLLIGLVETFLGLLRP